MPSATTCSTAATMAATAALLSAPKIVSSALTTTPFRTSGRMGAVAGTVSRWAFRKIGVPVSTRRGQPGVQIPDLRADGRARRRPRRPPAPIARQASGDHVGHGPFLAGRAGDLRQLEEQVEHCASRGRQPVQRAELGPQIAHQRPVIELSPGDSLDQLRCPRTATRGDGCARAASPAAARTRPRRSGRRRRADRAAAVPTAWPSRSSPACRSGSTRTHHPTSACPAARRRRRAAGGCRGGADRRRSTHLEDRRPRARSRISANSSSNRISTCRL